ncbi:MAG: VanZ family protein [Bacteroidaceae bacterium]|nr:VanZ family protein [Bacteroidaceae bacterium]
MLTNLVKHYPLTILTTMVVMGLSLFPFGPMEIVEDVPLADKWTHMVMYFGLTAVFWLEYWRGHDGLERQIVIPWGMVAPIVLGGVMELMQKYCTNYRSGEWMDFVADSIGVAIGVLVGLTLLRRLRWFKR